MAAACGTQRRAEPQCGQELGTGREDGGRRQRCLRRRASDSNPAPLFSWLRTGSNGD